MVTDEDFDPEVQAGDYGDVLIDGKILAEYDDEKWNCSCGREVFCERGLKPRMEHVPRRGNMRINLLLPMFCSEEAPCERCGCATAAICFRPGEGSWAPIDFFRLTKASAERRRRLGVELLAGPCIYIAQLTPDVAPCRLKVGFSSNVAARLRTYKSGCPGAQMIAVREGGRNLEAALIQRFAASYHQLSPEVFEVSSVDEAIAAFREVG